MNEKFNIRVTTNDEPATQFNNRATTIHKNMVADEIVDTSIIGITKSCKAIIEDTSGFSTQKYRFDLVAGSFILEIKRLIYKAFYTKYVEDNGRLKVEANTDYNAAINDCSVEESINSLRHILITCMNCNENINWDMVNIAKSNLMLAITLIGYDIPDKEIYQFINSFIKMIEGCKIFAD